MRIILISVLASLMVCFCGCAKEPEPSKAPQHTDLRDAIKDPIGRADKVRAEAEAQEAKRQKELNALLGN
jgi:hypothetical protein